MGCGAACGVAGLKCRGGPSPHVYFEGQMSPTFPSRTIKASNKSYSVNSAIAPLLQIKGGVCVYAVEGPSTAPPEPGDARTDFCRGAFKGQPSASARRRSGTPTPAAFPLANARCVLRTVCVILGKQAGPERAAPQRPAVLVPLQTGQGKCLKGAEEFPESA